MPSDTFRCGRYARRYSSIFAILAVSVLACSARIACAWGREGHEMITAAAIQALPEPLRGYFQRRQFYLVEHASDPDALSRQNPSEHVHHFTDADAYSRFPFSPLRRQFVTEDRPPTEIELKNGDSIWQIDRLTLRLASDFRNADWPSADHDAVFLAHYAADLTQPLHTTANYDGQETGQNGIHERFETELVRMNADRWNLHSAPATAIPQLRQRIFSELLRSHSASQAVFADDLRARAGRTYASPDFLSAFSALAAPLAEARLEDAATFVGSLWYTAWLKAGKPDLSGWPSNQGQ